MTELNVLDPALEMETAMKEIVGAMIGSMITNDRKTIHDAVASGRTDIQFLDRRHMQFMANCDLGKNWVTMAAGPTLFLVDHDGVPHAPSVGEDNGR